MKKYEWRVNFDIGSTRAKNLDNAVIVAIKTYVKEHPSPDRTESMGLDVFVKESKER